MLLSGNRDLDEDRRLVSAISQNQPGIIEIKGFKTSHFN
jgi:hypothetical protein